VVRGLVQGVFYRASAQRAALAEGLSGWIRNRNDGAVEGEAQGPTEAVTRFLDWCRTGPPSARVEGVETVELAVAGGAGFEVRR